jgi:hypothetical protein
LSEKYRGVRLHADQSPDRLRLVRAELDLVWSENDLVNLIQWAGSCRNAPESRILAGMKAVKILEAVGDQRQRRPGGLSVASVRAMTAGLSERSGWLNPFLYASDLDHDAEVNAVPREKPLDRYGPGGKLRVGPLGYRTEAAAVRREQPLD